MHAVRTAVLIESLALLAEAQAALVTTRPALANQIAGNRGRLIANLEQVLPERVPVVTP